MRLEDYETLRWFRKEMTTSARLFYLAILVYSSAFLGAGCNLIGDDNDPESYCTEVLEGNSDLFDITPGTTWEYTLNRTTITSAAPGDSRRVGLVSLRVIGPGNCVEGAQEIILTERFTGAIEFFIDSDDQRDLGWQLSDSLHLESRVRFIVSDSLEIDAGEIGASISGKFRLPWSTKNAAEDSVVVSQRDLYTFTAVTLEKGKGIVTIVRNLTDNRNRQKLTMTLVEDGE